MSRPAMGPLVFQPANINALVRDKVLRRGYPSLSRGERAWYKSLIQRERAARKGYVLSEYRGRETLAPEPSRAPEPSEPSPPVDPLEESRRALNRRLKSTLRKARSAERRQNRRTQRQIWRQLANIGQEYQRQGRRYSERMKDLKAELIAEESIPPQPIPLLKKPFLGPAGPAQLGPQGTLPLKVRMPPLSPQEVEETYREPPASWRGMSPLRGGNRTRKNKYRGRK